MNSWARRLRDSRCLALAQVFALVVLMLAFLSTEAIAPERAEAFSAPTGAWTTPVTGATDTSTSTPVAGLTTTIATAGATDLFSTTTLGARGFDATQFTPTSMVTGDPGANVLVNTGGCAAIGTCAGLGTVTLSFSNPVRNPTIHLAGLGQAAQTPTSGTVTGQSDYHAVLQLTTPGVTISRADGNTQFTVTGNTISAANDSASMSCTTNANANANQLAAAATAACGSVLVNGTVSTLTFNVSAVFVKNGTAPAAFNSPTSSDSFGVVVTYPEDFSDAPRIVPAAYGSPSHILSDLTLGSAVTEDNQNVRNGTTSPLAGVGATGDSDDAFASLADISIANAGGTYSLTVPVSGVSKAAQLCGYIDWNKGNSFATTGGERACVGVAANATSAVLTWTGIPTLTAGATYARFRLGYTLSQLQSPTARSSSGEVEDYAVNLVAHPRNLAKTAGVMSGPNATGDYTATYAVTVTNPSTPATTYGPITDTPAFNSNLTITGASWTGPSAGSATGAGPYTLGAANTAIAAGATHTYNVTITFRYTGTGTATACGGPGTGLYNAASLPSPQETGVTTDNSACLAAPPRPVSAITIDKQAAAPSGNTAGSTIDYSFIVTNSGTVPLTAVAVSDPKVGPVTCPVSTLAAGATTTCTKSYLLTQADVEAGVVSNTATATGTPPSGMSLSNASAVDTVNTPITRAPAITIDKTAGPPTGNAAGATILYSFVVTNTGNVALNQVGVTDPKVGPVSCPVSQLAPGAATTCTKSYVITQADVNAGTVNNTATASGTPQTGPAVTASDSVVTPIVRTTSITMDKQSGGAQGNTVGSSINYVFLVTNTGNVTVTGLTVTDPTVGPVSCPLTTLTPGQSTNCSRTYSLTQVDIDAGHVANTATATATPPSGMTPPSATDSTDTPITVGAAISLDKQGGPPSGSPGNVTVGSQIAYSFVIRNTGNVTLSSVGVADPKVGPITCPVTTLAPNATTTCTKSYSLTQADVNAGVVNNTATASGTPAASPTVTSTDSVTTPIPRSAVITLDKRAGTPTGATAGSTIAYSFVVTNAGNVTLNPVSVSDPLVGAINCPVTNLAPAATTTCTASYTITQANVDSGHVANTATATGTPPSGVTAPTASDSTDTTIAAAPSITLDKQGSTPTGNAAGSTIAYAFVLTNTGNVSLSSVGVSDPKVGPVSCPVFQLAPGAATTCTKSYVITQADVNAGTVNNTATASGTPQTGPAVTATDSVVTPITRTTSITLDKQSGGAQGTTAGSSIAYTFVVTNTGNTTLSNVGVTDPKVGAVACPLTTLTPGQSTTCAATYTLTQADVDLGHVANTATATGTPPSGLTAPTAADSTDTPITAGAQITLDKQVDAPAPGAGSGTAIRYWFVMTNTGNVTLSNVGVSDPKVGAVTCAVTTIAPSETTTCTRTYTLTQADVDAGVVNNTATATGSPPVGADVSATDSNSVPIPRSAAVTLDKQAGTPTGATAGSTIPYSFVVTNAGNVTLSPVSVSDPLVGAINCPVTNLAPAATTTCTASYTITQANVDSGHVANTATATGTPPSGVTAPTASDSTDTTIAAAPSITLDKQGSTPTGDIPGSTITYTFIVTNSGNVTLDPVSVTDPKVGPVTCPATSLAPGASTTCTKNYLLTQADVDAGTVNNTATATGEPPVGIAVTASDSVVTPIAQTASITLDKQSAGVTDVDDNGPDVGDTIAYSFVVGNSGTTTLTDLAVTDPRVGPVTCPATTLLPTGVTTCSTIYTLTQADVDEGHVPNTATATATPPGALTPPIATDSTDTLVAPGPGITLDKQGGTPTGVTAGSTIDYTFVVTNSGNVSLSGVLLSDPTIGEVICPADALAPSASTTCTKTYTLTQADVDAGSVNNTATASGTPPAGPVVSATDSVATPITRTATITLDKSAGAPSGLTAGSTIAYDFTVTNTGNVTLSPISVFDAKVGTVTCPSTSLAPLATTVCTATHTLTQTDVDLGHFANNATVTGTPPAGLTAPTASDTTDTPIVPTAAITLDKTAGTPTGDPLDIRAGATITYDFVVTNSGNVTLDQVSLADPKAGPVSCPASTLGPGHSTSCTKVYTLTQADVNAGEVVNEATASGTTPSGSIVTGTDTTTTLIAAAPALALDKQAGAPTGNVVGSTIDYTFVARNTGNVTLDPVSISDPLVGLTCPDTTLTPGAATVCSATYALTQVDVDSGHFANTATATAAPPTGPAITASDATDTPIAGIPGITLDKTAGTPSGSAAGSTIDYEFTVTNSGNVTLDPVSVSDPLIGDVTCAALALAPSGTTSCAATYTLTQEDVDAGHVANTATATGVPPVGLTAPTATDDTDTTIAAGPAITLDKTAGIPTGATHGSTIDYEFLVTNTGNVTLGQVQVHDPMVGAVSCPESSLAPVGSMLCTATYTLTQHDVDAGAVDNSATVAGTPPRGDPVTATDTTTTELERTATVTLDKQAATPSGATAGSTIDYTFVVTNTGNVTLDPITISDPKAGAVECHLTSLIPGATTTCNATYTLTQADVDAGLVENIATVTGTPPAGVNPPATATDTTQSTIEFGPTISLDKQASEPTGDPLDIRAGSTIDYTFVITNTGNVTLNSVALDDPKVGIVTCPATTLAPGGVTTCAATYEITQADVDAGIVENDATASGTPPVGAPVTATDFTASILVANPAITLDKQAGPRSGNSAGDTIEYSFVVTNTGNVTLDAFAVDDPLIGPTPGDVTCPLTDLAPMQSMTCTALYSLSQLDVDRGHVANAATVSATPPIGDAVTASDDTDTAIEAAPAVTLEKTAGAPSGNPLDIRAGSTIDYTFAVANTGNVTLDPVDVDDPTVGPVICPAGVLAPGESMLCAASYTLTQADVDAGNVHNDATATGRAPSGVEVTATDSTDSPIAAAPAIAVDKQAGEPTGAAEGETIAYTFVLTNTGNVTLDSISLSDPQVGAVTCPESVLAPGASTTCATTYTLTQIDVDSGHFANTVTATGTSPTDAEVTATDDTDTPITRTPGLTLDKQAGAPTGNPLDIRAGSTITYTFVVTNTGNVTLSSTAVSDSMFAAVTCPDDTLSPGEVMTCEEVYTLTQEDVDAGAVHNHATATATAPGGAGVTAADETDTLIAAAPVITLDKQAGAASGNVVGATVDYAFVVTNTGNVTLDPVTVDDPRVGAVACPVQQLAPTASTTCTASYQFTQADVDSGHFANLATATGSPPSGADVTASDETDTLIPANPAITLDKQAGHPSGNSAGSTIAYEFRVTNTGNVTLDPVTVDDPSVGPVNCPDTTLVPDQATTCTVTYVVTQVDVDAGNVHNEATASGTPPAGADVSATDTTDTIIEPDPAITLDKQAAPPTGDRAGDTIDYTFLVANSGNVTLNSVSVTDPKAGEVSCPESVLAPDVEMTCLVTYTMTQADVDLGEVVNNATASGTPPTGAPVLLTDTTTTLIAADPVVALDKQAGVPTGDRAGDTIDYTFIVTNEGNVTLDPVAIDDSLVGDVTCPVTRLLPTDSTTCTSTYTMTQVDVDSGHVANTATASATPPVGAAVTATDDTDTAILAAPALILEKTAGEPSGNTAGDTIDYTFGVTNAGNVTLNPVSVADPKVGEVTCPETTLAPDGAMTCSATYTLTQSDVDAGEVINNATASGTPPTGQPVTSDDTTTTTIPAAPAITLDKQAGTPSGNSAGDTIDFTFLVANSGNVTLDPALVEDPAIGPVDCPAASLAPGASTTCTATYTLTQLDVDSGHFANTATATGAPPIGEPVTAVDDTDTPILAEPAVTLDKQAGIPSGNSAGDTIEYTFVIGNPGNVTLDPVVLADPAVGEVACPVTVLAPGATSTCTATYVLTQGDVDAGEFVNVATVSGTPPFGDAVSAQDTTTTLIEADPVVTLDKQAGIPSGNSAGDTIEFTFVVGNDGNVTLDPVSVDDPSVGAVSCPETVLAPGATTTCTATYVLTQGDVDAGHFANTATATGSPPAGAAVLATDDTDTPILSEPGIALVKQAALEPNGNRAGAFIDYTFVVTNTGNVTLDPVAVEDPLVGAVTCPQTTLAPDESVECSATYALTQADVDAGTVHNEATASGAPPLGDDVTATDFTDTAIESLPAVALDKTAAEPSGSRAGDTIEYSFAVTNTGNVTLDPVSVVDPMVGEVTCPATRLSPDAVTTCTATYVLTQSDVNSGQVVNIAMVSGAPPTGDPVSAEDTTTTDIPALPAIALDKQAGVPTGNRAGDTIDYTFIVTNTGNVTLDPIAVQDSAIGAVSCPLSLLDPNESTTCLATYSLTQLDVDSGHFANTANAFGTPPAGDDVSASDDTDTVILGEPLITLEKTAGVPTGNRAGDTIDYTFVVANTGNVTLDQVIIDDPMLGPVPCTDAGLAPGLSTTCAATYTLTQGDVDSGQVINNATVSGAPPIGDPATAEDTTTTTIEAAPAITLDKRAGALSGNTAGSTIDYEFTVTNTGNVTLAPIGIADPAVGTVICPAVELAPNESTTCSATYSLLQADVDAGHFANLATASGTPPSGDDVTATDETDTPIDAAPAVTLDKVAGDPTGNRAGDTIDYTFLVTNTGNVTLDPVSVDDPIVGDVTCPDTVLAPDASTTCEATYVLTQADVDLGHRANAATANGTPPIGDDVVATDETDTPIQAAPAITVDKQAAVPSGNRAGATIDYTFLVTNTGNVTLDPVSVDDPIVGDVICPDTVLAPDASTTCAATYTLTQTDVDAGAVLNGATASGIPPIGDAVIAEDTVTTLIPSEPVVVLDKSVTALSGVEAGDQVDYSFLVTNAGNVTLDSIVVDDPLVAAVDCPVQVLGPDASTTCTGVYTLTQANVDAGEVVNFATASGTAPNDVVVTADDSTTTGIPGDPSIAFDKQASAPSGDPLDVRAGDTVDYTFIVTNTGNVTLNPVVVTDPIVSVACPSGPLPPDVSVTCTATYVLTQLDVDSGHLANTATATATPPAGDAVTATDDTDTPIVSAPAILLDKQAGAPTGNFAGDTIDYAFVVTNTGNVTLASIGIDDPALESVACPVEVLAPAESTTCAATYTLDQTDVDAGHVANSATASGNSPTDEVVAATDETDTPIESGPALTLEKTAGPPSGNLAGSTINYEFIVTNTGNVTLNSVAIDDPLVGEVACPTATLAPAASLTCTATYEITQQEVDAGTVVNVATATGTPPVGDAVAAEDSTTTAIESAPAILLEKQADPVSEAQAGGTVAYSFVITNSGNVTLDSLSIDDPLVDAVPTCPVTVIAPGESATCRAAYTLTQGDLDVGQVVNTAEARGTSPTGNEVSSQDTATTPLDAAPQIVLVKRANTAGPIAAGGTVKFTFDAKNEGNVTLSEIRIEDLMLEAVTCPVTTLPPRAITTCVGSPYTVTAADVAAGNILNRAAVFARGRGSEGDTEVSATAEVTVLTASPAIRLDKGVEDTGPYAVGQQVNYTFKVTNTGGVTLTGVDVTDAMLGNVRCRDRVLTPGDTTKCTAAPYTVTIQDVRRGSVTNTATATGSFAPTGRAGGPRVSDIVVADKGSARIRTTAVDVLPFTGTPFPQVLPLAAITMLGAGLALLVASRRKRRTGGADA